MMNGEEKENNENVPPPVEQTEQAEHVYAKTIIVDNNPNMDCQEYEFPVILGPFTGTPYDEDCEDDEEEEEPVEWYSPPPSPVPQISYRVFGHHEDDEMHNISDLTYNLDNVSIFMQAIDEANAPNTQPGTRLQCLGVYKFVYNQPKNEPTSPNTDDDDAMQETAATGPNEP